jgi:chemotaxis protein methyltransferase CheR
MSHLGFEYEYLSQLVRRESANIVDVTSRHHFDARLTTLIRQTGVTTLAEFVNVLRNQPIGYMHRLVAEAMTVNETSFFRDIDAFDVLRDEILPQLIERRRHTRTLNIWSAASSSGQEAYSLAILLDQHFSHVLAGWDVRIFGTDFSSAMVRYAQRGCYKRIEVNRGLPARLLVKYFTRYGDEWEFNPSLRHLCEFRQMNLCMPLPPMPAFDLVLLRNVLIYISAEDRAAMLNKIHSALADEGALMLGMAEQPTGAEDHFTPVFNGRVFYYRPLKKNL